MDLRLRELPFDYEGRRYLLRCNMNVLADVQEENGGVLSPALDGSRYLKSSLQLLAAMMNDYADEQGWFMPGLNGEEPALAQRFSSRALGRALVHPEDIPSVQIVHLAIDALTPPKTAESDKTGDEPGDEGN